MPKQLNQKKNKNSRKKSAGSGEKMHILASIKANAQLILADINRIEEEGDDPDERCDLSEIKKNAIQANVLINNLIEEQQNADITEKNQLEQVITTNGFTGTIGELLKKIREKIIQLSKYNNEGHEQTITNLKTLLDSIESESVNIKNIKEILKGGRIKFKNNKLFFSKSKTKRRLKIKWRTSSRRNSKNKTH